MGAYRLSEAKELAIYTWISTILSGLTVIWDKPNRQRPALPYATLNISSGPRGEGSPDMRYKEPDTFTHTIRKVFTLTVNIYAENAYLSYMESLINSLNLSTTQDALRAAGLAIRSNSDPVDLSRLLDTQYEQRVSADFFLAYAGELDDVSGEIARVTYAGEGCGFIEQKVETA